MIVWANANQGFTFLVLTLALVLLTAVYVFATWRMARLMRESNRLSADNIRQVTLLEKARMRPHVHFSIVAKDHLVRATIRNDGVTPATNILLSVTPPLTHDAGTNATESALTRGRIARLAPSQEYSDLLDSGPQFFARYKPPRFRGQVEYSDMAGNTYQEPFDLDLAFAAELHFTMEKDVGREVEKVGKEIEAVRKVLENRLPNL